MRHKRLKEKDSPRKIIKFHLVRIQNRYIFTPIQWHYTEMERIVTAKTIEEPVHIMEG